MSETVEATFTIKAAIKHSKTDNIGTGIFPVTINYEKALTVDLFWADERQVAGAAEDLDLAGVLTEFFGDTLTVVKLKAILFVNLETTDGWDLSVLGDANGVSGILNAASEKLIVPADGAAGWVDPNGITVTAGTGDIIQVDPGANTIDYQVVVLGSSS